MEIVGHVRLLSIPNTTIQAENIVSRIGGVRSILQDDDNQFTGVTSSLLR